MLIHIVKTGETVDKITDSYRILKSDLISNNLHITDFSHLKSGMKLKIPLISKDTIETLEESEAFIDDYYPSFEKFLNDNEKVNKEEVKIEIIEDNVDVVETKEINNEEITEDIIEIKPEEIKQEEINKPLNNNVYQSSYRGNVIPKYNEKFIRKI
ncbi:MAG: LysM peptidoglycan-binding domain-containing protein [bacterium]